MTSYDAIIIGSGAGGLTAAVALAQAGKKVLVLEQHDRPGGWTHSFTLEGYRFSPGVHYIGDLQEGGGLRRIYDGLGVSQDLSFVELNPNGYDHIVVGNKQINFPKGKENLIAELKRNFPHEAQGIDGYFSDLLGMINGLLTLRGAWDRVRENPILKFMVIALTGYGRDEDQVKAKTAGFDLHLTKPVDFALLQQTIDSSATLCKH